MGWLHCQKEKQRGWRWEERGETETTFRNPGQPQGRVTWLEVMEQTSQRAVLLRLGGSGICAHQSSQDVCENANTSNPRGPSFGVVQDSCQSTFSNSFLNDDYTELWVLAPLVAQTVKHLPTMPETWVQSLGWEDPLEKEMTTHSSVLAWRIPWTEEPGGLQSMGLQIVSHDWVTSLHFN